MISRRVIRWLSERTVLALILLLVLVESVAMAVVEASPGVRGITLGLTAAAAVLAGWLLAQSPFPGWLAALLGIIIGCEGIILGIGRLGEELLGVIRALAQVLFSVLQWPWEGRPELGMVHENVLELGTETGQVLQRLWLWLSALVKNDPMFDTLAIALVWHLIIWTVALWAAWMLCKRKAALRAMAPAGALLGAVLSFHRSSIDPLVIFLLTALPLLALVRYGIQHDRWQQEQVDYPEDTGTELSYAVIGLTIVVVSIGLGIPNLSVRQITRYARDLFSGPAEQSDRVAESLGISRGAWEAEVLGSSTMPGLPRQHLLGGRTGTRSECGDACQDKPSPG